MGTYFLALPLSVPNKTASVICVYLRLHHVTLLEPQQWISILFRKKKKEGKKEGRKEGMVELGVYALTVNKTASTKQSEVDLYVSICAVCRMNH